MRLSLTIKKKLAKFELDVALRLPKGCTGLVGHSGSGKSMTLRCIAGIETPDSGRIILNDPAFGERILFDREAGIDLPPQKRRIGYLFQNYALFENMTVAGNIACGPQAQGLPAVEIKARTEDLIRRFRLQGLENRHPRQLSGGEKQRVALARILAGEPEAILLDEPLAALDADLKEELITEMKQVITDCDCPIILVSHNMAEIEALCGSCYRIAEGKITGEAGVLMTGTL